MTYEIATVACGGAGLKIPGDDPITVIDNRDNRMTPCEAYQKALEQTRADVLIYLHDDVEIHDDWWREHVVDCFEDIIRDGDSNVVAVGFGGALALGNKDLYRKPFNIWDMARRGYASNATDAETHGERFTGVRQCAVLDAYCMAVRVPWLRSRRSYRPPGGAHAMPGDDRLYPPIDNWGWPVSALTHHGLDMWLACEAARDNKEIWQIGVSCTHHGGGTSVKPVYANAKWLQGGSMEQDHIKPHLFLYNEYRDVLPIEITESQPAR